MQTGTWIASIISAIIVGLFLLWLVIRTAVRRGGRKVEYLNPEELIIFPKTESSVTRLNNDDLKIQWQVDAEQVQIFSEQNPKRIDHGQKLAQTSKEREIITPRINAAIRPYFELAFTGGTWDGRKLKVAERHVPLEGAYNFRDLGGYRTQEGQYICWGKLFRADELSELTDADLDYLRAMDISTIIDLRSPIEMRGKENRLPPGVVYRHMRIYKKEPIRRYLLDILFRRHKLSQAMGASYPMMAEENAEAFGAVLRRFADPKNLPAIFHCSAGKDRTGIITAYLYAFLGVPDETIIADYSLSNLGFDHYFTEFIASGRIARSGIPPDEFRALFMVDPAWMENLLTYIGTNYGSMQNYLIQKAGLDQTTLNRIRENMLE